MKCIDGFDTLSTSTGDVARIGFIGQEQDIEHGYFNMGARYYDPEIGRFLSEILVILIIKLFFVYKLNYFKIIIFVQFAKIMSFIDINPVSRKNCQADVINRMLRR
jgi:hypothetical protein